MMPVIKIFILNLAIFAYFIVIDLILVPQECSANPVTLMISNLPEIITGSEPEAGQSAKSGAGTSTKSRQPMHENASENSSAPETDILISMVAAPPGKAVDMDFPQYFACIFYPANPEEGREDEPKAVRSDLLGDIEEIAYEEKKAWGANVDLSRDGLYQFIAETKPWWDELSKSYYQQQAKLVLPVNKADYGWDLSTGQALEILPLTRPFGLKTPALFAGRAMADGKPLANALIKMAPLSKITDTAKASWQSNLEAKTDENGQFSFVLNSPGWWYCVVSLPIAPLKGPDGELSPVELTSILWLNVGK